MPYKNAYIRRFYQIFVSVPAHYHDLEEMEAMRRARVRAIHKAQAIALTEQENDQWDAWPLTGSVQEGSIIYRVVRKRPRPLKVCHVESA